MSKRSLEKWTLAKKDRKTLNQKLGGALYDIIDQIKITKSNGRRCELLWCIRDESHMGTRTLQRIFKGKNDSIEELQRFEFAMREWADKMTVKKIMAILDKIKDEFYDKHCEAFLEEERLSHKPKRKS